MKTKNKHNGVGKKRSKAKRRLPMKSSGTLYKGNLTYNYDDVFHEDLKNIQINLTVRAQTDENRLNEMVLFLKANPEKDLPPVILAKNGRDLLEGRHTYCAYVNAERTTIPCVIDESVRSVEEDYLPAIRIATQANVGSLQPTKQDLELLIKKIINNAGLSYSLQDAIKNLNGIGFSRNTVTIVYKQVYGRIQHKKMMGARQDVAKGMSLTEAAKKHNVRPIALERAIGGTGKDEPFNIRDGKAKLSANIGTKTAKFIAGLDYELAAIARDFEDGLLLIEDVQYLLDKAVGQSNRIASRLAHWNTRYESIASEKRIQKQHEN